MRRMQLHDVAHLEPRGVAIGVMDAAVLVAGEAEGRALRRAAREERHRPVRRKRLEARVDNGVFVARRAHHRRHHEQGGLEAAGAVLGQCDFAIVHVHHRKAAGL